ncbi:hypothetical protein G7046_g10076 [Stylonectria norvegica]|nr:hypothetical protein G7046_g10076 [Stylonectria norvegica]
MDAEVSPAVQTRPAGLQDEDDDDEDEDDMEESTKEEAPAAAPAVTSNRERGGLLVNFTTKKRIHQGFRGFVYGEFVPNSELGSTYEILMP